MSIDAYRWAYRQHPKRVEEGQVTDKKHPAAKLVLITLADFVSKGQRHCWPSQKLLAEATDLSERQVRRCLADLQDQNLITREERRRNDKTRRSDRIYLCMTADDVGAVQDADEDTEDQADELSGRPVAPTGRECSDQADESSGHEPTTENLPKNATFVNTQVAASPKGEPPGKRDEFQGWQVEEYLRDELSASDVPLTRSKARRYTRDANKLHAEGVSESELYEAADRVVSEWERVRLSLDDALRDLRNGRQSNGFTSRNHLADRNPAATPLGVVEYIFENTKTSAIKNNETNIRRAMHQHDFMSGEPPKYNIEKLLGGSESERWQVLDAINSLCKRAKAEEVA